mmetsp:Transcript_17631/g.48698  ORF Transcript_17631/g.48698 Transcript_17631/m.48698 type:complete len:300 (+) Transcript_17631:1104-2003(+)
MPVILTVAAFATTTRIPISVPASIAIAAVPTTLPVTVSVAVTVAAGVAIPSSVAVPASVAVPDAIAVPTPVAVPAPIALSVAVAAAFTLAAAVTTAIAVSAAIGVGVAAAISVGVAAAVTVAVAATVAIAVSAAVAVTLAVAITPAIPVVAVAAISAEVSIALSPPPVDVLHAYEVTTSILVAAVRLGIVPWLPACEPFVSGLCVASLLDVLNLFNRPLRHGNALNFVAELAVQTTARCTHKRREGLANVGWPNLGAVSTFLVCFVAALERTNPVHQVLVGVLLHPWRCRWRAGQPLPA